MDLNFNQKFTTEPKNRAIQSAHGTENVRLTEGDTNRLGFRRFGRLDFSGYYSTSVVYLVPYITLPWGAQDNVVIMTTGPGSNI